MQSAAWLTVSTGLRKALDVGAHRKKIYRGSPNSDDELWKRAFWILVVFDRLCGAHFGRASGIADEDFDIDLPLEVDDEYWDSAYDFKQPPAVPSKISAFNQFIKITQIMAFTLRTVYAVDTSKVFNGLILGDWRNEVIQQLNTAMEEWSAGVPEHLKWSDKMTNITFSSQAATIHSLYHLTQLLIYRPFIPNPILFPSLNNLALRLPTKSRYFRYPALTLSISAAKSCARIIKAQRRFGLEGVHVLNLIHTSCLCASTLLLGVWDLKTQQRAMKQKGANLEDVKPPLAMQIEDLMKDIQVLVDALEWVKPRWEFVEPFLSKVRESLPDDQHISSPSMTSTSRPHEQTQTSTAELRLSFPVMKQVPSNMHWPSTSPTLHVLPSPSSLHAGAVFSRLPSPHMPPPPDPNLFLKQQHQELHSFADVNSAEDEQQITLPLVNHPLLPRSQRAGRYAKDWDHPNGRGRTISASIVPVPVPSTSYDQPVSYNGHSLRRTWSSGSLDGRRVHADRGREKLLRRQGSFSSMMLSSSYPSAPDVIVCDDINMHEPLLLPQQHSQRLRMDSVKHSNPPHPAILSQQEFGRVETWDDSSRHGLSRHGDYSFRSASGMDRPNLIQPSTSRTTAPHFYTGQIPPDSLHLAHPPTQHPYHYQPSTTYAQYHHPS